MAITALPGRSSAPLALALAGLLLATSAVGGTGALDTTFGTGGVAAVPGFSVAVQGDGKIVALGAASITQPNLIDKSAVFALRRLTSAGGIDFATTSVVGTCGFCSFVTATTAATVLQGDGRILTAGMVEETSLNTGACRSVGYKVTRHLAGGGLDPGFGSGGVATVSFFGKANALALQADGKVVIAGSKKNYGCLAADQPEDHGLARLNADGTLDTAFGVSGRVAPALGTADDAALAVAVQPDGKIVVGGYATNATHRDFSIARFGSGGALEESALHDVGAGSSDTAFALALQPDGKFLLGGSSGTHAALLRLASLPSLDAAFATGGRFLVPGTAIVDIALQPDGKIVAVTSEADVLRLHDTGALDPTFGIGGRLSLAIAASSVALQADGGIVVGGASAVARIDPAATLPITPAPVAADFGAQSMRTTSPAQTVTLTNTGNGSQTIASIAAPAEYAVTHDCTTLPAGASCTAMITFTPAAQGSRNASLVVTGSAGTQKVFLLGTGELSLVTHYYRAILNRVPDAAGKAYWDGEFTRLAALGADPVETWYVLAGYFFASVEYASYNKTDGQFIADLYNTFFNRPPDPTGTAYWSGQIAGGLPREVVMISFMFSNEFRTFTQGIFGVTAARPEVNLVMDFFRGILNRAPDTASLQYWLGRMRAAQCAGAGPVYTEADAMSAAFIFNPEYNSRNRNNTQFVTDMYYSFLRRGGDAGGVNYWINELATGSKDVNAVRINFLGSPEFGARVQAVIAAGCYP